MNWRPTPGPKAVPLTVAAIIAPRASGRLPLTAEGYKGSSAGVTHQTGYYLGAVAALLLLALALVIALRVVVVLIEHAGSLLP